ncbi:hypothetical protein [Candidatus Rhodobacter oscarellae]|uniref:hypothetical protein n=1 Tax=Candidatus Rhodobacter oscarellae TaxID=1675527 RepID=UPI000670E884|nr:hypothetical protein [Candidatus Rhodobacter lobularis]
MSTFKENMINKAHKFIKNHVPRHTQAEYEALLVTNTDLALQLISKWQQLEELTASYHALQREATRSIPMPPVTARADAFYMLNICAKSWSVRWSIDPYHAEMRLSDNPFKRTDPQGAHIEAQEVAKAFHDVFHRDYVPRLWEATAQALSVPWRAERAA